LSRNEPYRVVWKDPSQKAVAAERLIRWLVTRPQPKAETPNAA
jgi:hypothetical protein